MKVLGKFVENVKLRQQEQNTQIYFKFPFYLALGKGGATGRVCHWDSFHASQTTCLARWDTSPKLQGQQECLYDMNCEPEPSHCSYSDSNSLTKRVVLTW